MQYIVGFSTNSLCKDSLNVASITRIEFNLVLHDSNSILSIDYQT
jgi:hypothetical protein